MTRSSKVTVSSESIEEEDGVEEKPVALDEEVKESSHVVYMVQVTFLTVVCLASLIGILLPHVDSTTKQVLFGFIGTTIGVMVPAPKYKAPT